ncbi:hypothetical protein FA15DRAFT_674262 [Coprinopsis marcescibilis]|uniref:Uncharacterized protein n=1 Tax=Coprinopsis marcescibilis TaxID=230819 RepID=A0A5C3KUM9_COPMA|nr:hypothetical protein FA15DRAFT_674262 [Coprinopsis marcescibilis]
MLMLRFQRAAEERSLEGDMQEGYVRALRRQSQADVYYRKCTAKRDITDEQLDRLWGRNRSRTQNIRQLLERAALLEQESEQYIAMVAVFNSQTSPLLKQSHLDNKDRSPGHYIDDLRASIMVRCKSESQEEPDAFTLRISNLLELWGCTNIGTIAAAVRELIEEGHQTHNFLTKTRVHPFQLSAELVLAKDTHLEESAAVEAKAVKSLRRKIEKGTKAGGIIDDIEALLREASAIVGDEIRVL